MAKFFAGLFGLVILIGVHILIMIHGWGLEPKSWFWIIGVGFLNLLLNGLLGYIMRGDADA